MPSAPSASCLRTFALPMASTCHPAPVAAQLGLLLILWVSPQMFPEAGPDQGASTLLLSFRAPATNRFSCVCPCLFSVPEEVKSLSAGQGVMWMLHAQLISAE